MVQNKTRRTVTILREGQKIFVQPICPELELLQTTSIEPLDDPNSGFQLRRAQVPLYELYPDSAEGGEISFAKGLEPAVRSVLAKHGRRISQWFRNRRDAYRKAGWLPGNLNSTQARVEQFLEDRGL